MYTKEQVKELLRQQRELCAHTYVRTSYGNEFPAIENAPEPELPVVEPTSVENLIQKWEAREHDLRAECDRANLGSSAYYRSEGKLLEKESDIADLKALAVQIDQQEDQDYNWLPLFIDSHCHMCVGGTKESEKEAERIREKYLDAAIKLLHDLESITQ